MAPRCSTIELRPQYWWRRGESNPRSSACKTEVLPLNDAPDIEKSCCGPAALEPGLAPIYRSPLPAYEHKKTSPGCPEEVRSLSLPGCFRSAQTDLLAPNLFDCRPRTLLIFPQAFAHGESRDGMHGQPIVGPDARNELRQRALGGCCGLDGWADQVHHGDDTVTRSRNHSSIGIFPISDIFMQSPDRAGEGFPTDLPRDQAAAGAATALNGSSAAGSQACFPGNFGS